MKKFFLFLFFYPILCSSQTWTWAQHYGNTGNDVGRGIVRDSLNNLYVTGYFRSPSITFGSTVLTNSGGGAWDLFVAKFDSLGNNLWAKMLGVFGNDEYGLAISLDHAGNVYITGISGGFYIAKFSPNGNFQWKKNAIGCSTLSDAAGYGISTDKGGNIYATGYYKCDSISFGNTTLYNSSQCAGFFVKYDSLGNALWAKNISKNNISQTVVTDANGNSYLSGYFNYYYNLIGIDTIWNHDTSGLEYDIFVTKCDSLGNFLWSRSLGGVMTEDIYNITTNNSGDLFLAGYFTSDTIFTSVDTLVNEGLKDILVAKYDDLGNLKWIRRAGGANEELACSVAADNLGNCFITGYFYSNPAVFGNHTLYNKGGNDLFVAMYDSLGKVYRVQSAYGSSGDVGYSIASDEIGNCFVVGSFMSPMITFGSYVLSNNGTSNNLFISKLDTNYTQVLTDIDILDSSVGRIFPNPLQNYLWIQSYSQLGQIVIFNSLGQPVLHVQGKSNEEQIDMRQLSPGVYSILVQGQYYKVIKY